MPRSPPYNIQYTSVSTNDNANNNNVSQPEIIYVDNTGSTSHAGSSNLGCSMGSSMASICSSTQVVPNVNDLSAIDGSYLGAIYETNRNSKVGYPGSGVPFPTLVSDNTMLTEASGFTYSCADVSEALNHMTTKTPSNFRHLLMQTPRTTVAKDLASEIDMTTTTFKGGVSMATTESCVDPQDLVNRIDELFFQDMMV